MSLGSWSAAPVLAATYSVSTTADSGTGSLRKAILDANANPGADTIAFGFESPAPHIIEPTSPLPVITGSVAIASTATLVGGGPAVVIDGSSAGSTNGLVVDGTGGGTQIRGLRIVDFSGSGIYLNGVSGVVIDGNYIGTDGAVDQGNGQAGITLVGASGNDITDNLISGNGLAPGVEPCCTKGFGIWLADAGASGNTITGNRIGTNAAGTAAIGNGTYGIVVSSPGNQIGGTTAADRNLISGNGRGVQFVGSTTEGNAFEGNYVGTTAAGSAALGNGVHGILLNLTDDALVIGGTAASAGNVIASSATGILLASASNAIVQGNLIGVGADGTTALGNVAVGVQISGGVESSANGNTIGGTAAGAGNVIANNGGTTGDGVQISGDASGNRVLGNVIRANGGLGIDLGTNGVTANDAVDGDTGSNRLQNFPILTSTGPTDVFGTLDSGSGTYRIEIYANPACDASGHGEGATLLKVQTGVPPGPFHADAFPINGTFLSATATNETTGDTSEFGPCLLVGDGLPPAGTWVGSKSETTAGSFVGFGSGAAGPAQLTYDRLDPNPDSGDGESGEWNLYTTASSAGTIVIPWRLTGFHAYFQVRVNLEAFVISGSGPDTTSSLLAAGPTNCCSTPSAGFDHSGNASFTVAPGDIYGFTLTGSNGDSNETLQGELLLGTAIPADCSDAKDGYAATSDGRYVIHPIDGQRFSVHCRDVAATPKDYLTLSQTGAGRNVGSYAAGGASPGTTVTTAFTKVRLNPATLTVDVGDRTFATTSGGPLTHSGEVIPVTSMPYATAMACNSGVTNGTANIDLRGTPFAVRADETFVPTGTIPTGTAVRSSFDQVIDVTGNGFCGWNGPTPTAFDPFNPAANQFILDLRYAAATPVVLQTPVLFGAVTTGTTSAYLVGRVDGAANATLALEVSRSATCTDGVLGGGVIATGAPITGVVTDAAGYFGVLVSDIPAGDFVAVRVTSPSTTATSTCIRSSADNDYWPKALNVAGTSATARDVLDLTGKSRWYRFSVTPGQRITVSLSGLPADYDLAVFKDIGQEFLSQLIPQDAEDLTKLSAEYAPAVFSPAVFSPAVFSPAVFSPDAYSPAVFSPAVFSPAVFSPAVFSPAVFSPAVFSPAVFSPAVFSPAVFSPAVFSPAVFSPAVFSPAVFSTEELAQAFSSAQTRSIIGVSATPGTGNETVVVNTWNNTGEFYVRVAGHNGAFDPSGQFTVQVDKGPTSCASVTDNVLTPRSDQPGTNAYQTVILTDSSKLALGDGSPGTLRQKLDAFKARPEVKGVIVDVADPAYARVGTLKTQADNNAACPYAQNLVAGEIKGIVDSYRKNNSLKYVVIAGGDDVIPFFRYPDQSLLGQESGYVPPVVSTSPSEAALRRDFVLSQDAYGAGIEVSLRTSDFPVPNLAVGRLVETPTEVAGMLDAYTATNGVVAPGSSLVTGYDFLADAAEAVKQEFQAGTGVAPDTLVTANGVSPQDPASWTASQLSTKLLGSRHDVIFLAGHFSANSALAADFQTSLLTTDLASSSVNLTNTIVFSAGCHSGYNLLDGAAVTGVTQPLDWSQAFAQKQTTLVAGTGYQYGDTDFLEYSERLYRDFAKELRAGTGAIPIGAALVKAKLQYMATTPDLRGIHEKALLEATLFGLPMLGVNMPTGRGGGSGSVGVITPTPVPPVNGTDLRLATFDLHVTPTLTPASKQLTNPSYDAVPPTYTTARWLTGPAGAVVTNPAEPAVPLQTTNVTPTDGTKVLRGVGFRGGDFTDTPGIVPLTGAPTTELRGVHAPFVSPVFYPMRLWQSNYYGALGGTGGTNLLVTPVQHKTDDAVALTNVQRKYTGLDLKLFYSGNLTSAALSDAPTIVSVDAATTGSNVAFTAQVVGDPKATIQQVWITYTNKTTTGAGNGTWRSLDLQQCVAPLPAACGTTADSRLWKATLTGAPADMRFVVQAANGLGLVSFDDNWGTYYRASASGAPATPAATTLELIAPPSGGTFGDVPTITAELKSGSNALMGKVVTIVIGGAGAVGVTGSDGRVALKVALNAIPGSTAITASFGGDDDFAPSSDVQTPFTIAKAPSSFAPFTPFVTTTPTNSGGVVTTLSAAVGGKAQPLIQRTVTVTLTGPDSRTISAITNYLGQVTLPLGLPAGTYTVSVSFSGDETYTSAARGPGTVVIAPFTGFFSPVDNLPVLNVVKAGATIPVKFSLSGDRGLAIFASGYPRATKIACESGATLDTIEETSTSNSGLTYDPTTLQYKYNWKTPKSYVGSCYRLDLRLLDGRTYSANFQFK